MSKMHKPWVSHEELDAFLGGGVLDVLDHAASHEVGGADLLAFADIPDFGTYIDQALLQASSPLFANLNLGAAPLIRQSAGALTIQTDEGVNTDTIVNIKGKGTSAGFFRLYDEDDAEYLYLRCLGGFGFIDTRGTTPLSLHLQYLTAKDIGCWASIPAGNPYFYIYGWHVTDTDWMRMRVEADGDALIEAENKLNFRASGNEFNFGATPLIRQSAGALTIQTDEGVNTNTHLYIKGKGTGYGEVRIYDPDDAEYLQLLCTAGIGYLRTGGVAPGALRIMDNVAQDVRLWSALAAGNPLFYLYGWHATDVDWMRMGVEADGDALIEAENDLNLRAGGGDINLGDENLTTTGIVAATTLQGALHWDYITNEPTYYPPEYHYHIGRDIISLHLVDLDDIEADDIFDVLPTAAIHGEGNYDWWGTWVTGAGAGCSAEIVVEAGDDKILRLTDGNAATRVDTQLSTDADHPIVIGCIQFQVRQSSNAKEGRIEFRDTIGANSTYIQMADTGNIQFWDGAALTNLQAYAVDTWYTIRIYWDCVSAAVAVWVDNVWKIRKDLTALEFINNIYIRTKAGDTGYTLDINNLKVFNLTV